MRFHEKSPPNSSFYLQSALWCGPTSTAIHKTLFAHILHKMHQVINSWLMAPQTNVRTSYTLLNLYGGVKKILNNLYVGILFTSYTMVNTLAALVCGGHIVELKGSIPCSNNIVLSEVDNSKEKKLHIGFINNIDDT